MTSLVSVVLPGPWWNDLTYSVPDGMTVPAPGARVRVPSGRSTRVGICAGPGEPFDGTIRELTDVIDSEPIIPSSFIPLLRWFADTYLCGTGTAALTLLPKQLWDGAAHAAGRGKIPDPLPETDAPHEASADPIFIYEPDDAARRSALISLAADGAPTLICCPTHSDASAMYDAITCSPVLDGDVRRRVMLVPKSGPATIWHAWCRASRGGWRVAVGSQMSALLPLRGLSRIVVEDESSAVWRTTRSPVYNARTVLAMRARLEGTGLVLAGRMPSARAFIRAEREVKTARQSSKKVFWVDSRDAYKPGIADITGSIAISEPLARETERSARRGAWSVWVLDRKGYAGIVVCSECGSALTCPKCGGAMRWELSSGSTRCVVCGHHVPVPEVCPTCKGRLLEARRPGIEAVAPLAGRALPDDVPIYIWSDELDTAQLEPGLIVGTRAALSVLDDLRVGLVAWLDADGEAWGEAYDTLTRAFGLIWESMWRGRDPHDRDVLIQSRRPATSWLRGLDDPRGGWRTFWRAEIERRREFSMPPFLSLVRIDAEPRTARAIADDLARGLYEFWVADPSDTDAPTLARGAIAKKTAPARTRHVIWVRTKKTPELKRLLAPYFHIQRAKGGYPTVTVWHD